MIWNLLGMICLPLYIFFSGEIKSNNYIYHTILNEKIECGTQNIFKYCYVSKKSSKKNINKKTLYFFHGLYHNEWSWIYQRKNFLLRQKLYDSGNLENIDVISVSMGSFRIFNNGDLIRSFQSDFVPYIEKKYKLSKDRLIYGKSMGAFNVLQLAAKAPELFKKTVLGCPMVPDTEFHGSLKDIKKLASVSLEQNRSLIKVLFLDLFLRYQFVNKDWDNYSPLVLAAMGAFKTETLIHVGDQDEYGFQHPSKKLFEILKEKGTSSVFKEIPGSHCVVDVNDIIKFMQI